MKSEQAHLTNAVPRRARFRGRDHRAQAHKSTARHCEDREPRFPLRLLLAFTGAAGAIGLVLYWPCFEGGFVFDDSVLPVSRAFAMPLRAWIGGVRPVLMLSYWLNRTIWGDSLFAYHFVNLCIHAACAALVFLAIWRLLEWNGWERRSRTRAAAVGALVFLVHPLQTEAVSYIAGRSECLSTMFLLLAYTVFLYRRREDISWIEAAVVVGLFAVAAAAKENAVSLAGILVLTDALRPAARPAAGLRKNWRLYALLVPGATAAAVMVLRMLAGARSAGFSLRQFTWYQYALTEPRAIFAYLRLAVLPVGQSIDHDFPVSRTIFDNGAIVWMALLAALVWAAIRVRRQYPLACFGGLFFLIALAPTSSIVPIADPMVERRAYLPLVGLILIGCELCRRVRFPSARLAGVVAAAGLIVLSGLCHARNQLWGRPIELFASAAKHSKNKERPYRWLTSYLVREGRCAEAIQYLQYAERAFPRNDWIEMWWGGALECMGRREEAMKRLLAAAEIRPTSETYERIGLLLGAMNRSEDAGKALRLAVALDPNSATAHDSLGLWSESIGDFTLAAAEYERSVSLDPGNTAARAGIIRARALKSGPVQGGDRPAGDR